jgi:DNA repair exonuclease SbcCD ATPase subunit
MSIFGNSEWIVWEKKDGEPTAFKNKSLDKVFYLNQKESEKIEGLIQQLEEKEKIIDELKNELVIIKEDNLEKIKRSREDAKIISKQHEIIREKVEDNKEKETTIEKQLGTIRKLKKEKKKANREEPEPRRYENKPTKEETSEKKEKGNRVGKGKFHHAIYENPLNELLEKFANGHWATTSSFENILKRYYDVKDSTIGALRNEYMHYIENKLHYIVEKERIEGTKRWHFRIKPRIVKVEKGEKRYIGHKFLKVPMHR